MSSVKKLRFRPNGDKFLSYRITRFFRKKGRSSVAFWINIGRIVPEATDLLSFRLEYRRSGG